MEEVTLSLTVRTFLILAAVVSSVLAVGTVGLTIYFAKTASSLVKKSREMATSVLQNAEKQPLFSVKERVEMLREVTKQWSDVEIDVFDGLLVDYARKKGAGVILRGIRAVSDYEYELQMALMNRKLEPRLETVFMLPGVSYSYLSSKLVREIAQLGAPLTGLVPTIVEERLKAKIS